MDEKDFEPKLKELIEKAAGNEQVIPGRPLGRKPQFFIVGDAPSHKDILTGHSFSGRLGELLISAIETLNERFQAIDEDCYVTYLVKIPLERAQISRKLIEKTWLEILQLEYQLSGCDRVVCIGKISKTYAGLIPMRPLFMGPFKKPEPEPKSEPETKLGFMEKITACWEILCK